MKIYLKEDSPEKTLLQINCNKCGRRCDHHIHSDHMAVSVDWGYFSNKDLQRDVWDLCESCYDDFVKDFKIPIQEYTYEMLNYTVIKKQ